MLIGEKSELRSAASGPQTPLSAPTFSAATPMRSVVSGGVIGLACFLAVATPYILLPTNIAWLQGGDPASNYLMWATYRHAPWVLPPGMNPAYGLELATSILYDDAIPVMALALKPFSSLLGEPFQYFGLWLLLCFILQGVFAWKIGQALGFSLVPRIALACFLVTAPPFLIRLHGHYALCAQWLVLAALYLYLRPIQKTPSLAWIALVSLAAIVQPYLFVMVTAIWAADLVKRRWTGDVSWRRLSVEFGLNVLLVTVCLWMAGFFVIASGRAIGGYGLYHIDLLGLFNPLGWSRILPSFVSAANQFEGFCYLGLGAILLLIFALPPLLEDIASPVLTKRFLPLVAVLIILTLFAISNVVTAAAKPLVTLTLPEWATGITSTFRSSGRMFWPAYYAIIVGLVWLIVTGYSARTGPILLVLALAVQLIDTEPGWIPIQERNARLGTSWTTPLTSSWWRLAADRYKKIRTIPPTYIGEHWEEIGYYALTHGLETDTVYFSRIDTEKLRALQQAALARDGSFDRDTLYIFNEKRPSASLNCVGSQDLVATIDGLRVLAPGGAAIAKEAGVTSDANTLSLLPPLSRTIEFKSGGEGLNYLGPGWSWPEEWGIWSDGPSAALVFYLRKPETGFRFRLKSRGFPPNVVGKQHIQVLLDGNKLAEFDVGWAEGEFEFFAPAALVAAAGACHRLEFRPAQPQSPAARGMSADGRQLGIGLVSLEMSAE